MSRVLSGPVSPSSPRIRADRIIDPESGVTGGELAAYFAAASELLLSQLRERPVTLMQFDDGIDGPPQLRAHAGPSTLRDAGTPAPGLASARPPLLEIRLPTGLQSAAESGAIELHTWNATLRAIRKPDRIVLALDPADGATWSQLGAGAASVHAALSGLGLKSFLKTSGLTGLQVVLPLMPSRSWEFVERFTQSLVTHLVETVPGRFVDARLAPGLPQAGVAGGKARRGAAGGEIRIDSGQGGWGETSLCAWSPRAGPGVGISVPVAWDELGHITGGAHWTVRNAAERIAVGNRPWEQYAVSRQGLACAVKALGFEMTAKSN